MSKPSTAPTQQHLTVPHRTAPHGTAPQTNPAAAKGILVDVGLWTVPGQNEDGGEPLEERMVEIGDSANSKDGGGGGRGEGGEEEEGEAGKGTGVLPWSAEALQAAAALGKERSRRSANYGKRAPQGTVGAPAPFGRSELTQGAPNVCVCVCVLLFFRVLDCAIGLWFG